MPSYAQDSAFVDSLQQIVGSEVPDTTRVKALYRLTWHHLRYDLAKSRHYATRAFQLSQQLGDSVGMHRVYHYWGLIHRLESHYDSSLFYFQKVVDFNARRGAEEKSLQALFNMGVVNSFRGFYDRSLQYYLHVLRIAEEVGDDYMRAEALNSMGLIHKKLKNYDQALAMTRRASQLAERSGDPNQQANYLSNLGSLYAEQEVYDSALFYYRKTLVVDSTEGVLWGVGHQLNNIGTVYLEQGRLALAEDYLQRGLQIREELEQPKEIAESLIQVAALRNRQNQPGIAQEYAQRAAAIAEEIGDRPLLSQAYLYLAEAYAGQKNFHNAYYYQTAHTALKDSILSEKTAQQINSLQVQYETEKKEKEIALLTRDKEVQAASIRQKNTRIRALIAVFLFALLAIGLLYLLYRNRIRHHKQLRKQQGAIHRQQIRELEQKQKILAMESMLLGQENERKRIAKDLHDGLGNLLANVQMQFSTVQEAMPAEKMPAYEMSYQLLGEACGEVRKIAHNMMPGALTRFGLVAALQELAGTLEQSSDLDVDLQVYGLDERLPEKVEVSLYRGVQELLSNIVKHAEATSVIIQLNRQEDGLHVLVEDNGVGFDPEAVQAKDGLGIGSLHSRVRYMDGTMEIDTAPGKGTAVMVHVPLGRSGESLEARV